jgi:hypothetical protein
MSEKAKEGKARGAVQSYEPEPEPKRAGVEIERLSVKEIYITEKQRFGSDDHAVR